MANEEVMVTMATGRCSTLSPPGGARSSEAHTPSPQFHLWIEWGWEVGGQPGPKPFTNANSVDEARLAQGCLEKAAQRRDILNRDKETELTTVEWT